MKNQFAAFLLLSMSAFTADALLPPFYESRIEYATLIDSPELEKALGSGEAILSITRDEEGFTVKATKKTVHVKVVYERTGKIGPAQFHLEFE